MATSYHRGHRIIWGKENEWVYADTDENINDERACLRCKDKPTPEGYDACIGHVEGATSVCCGHGVCEPILIMRNK